MADSYLKVKDNGASGLALVRQSVDDAQEDLGVADLKNALNLSDKEIFGEIDDTFPLEFENGTYRNVSVRSTLVKYYGGGYDLTRKVVKSTVFNAPCNVVLTAKSGYGFTVFTANDAVITATSGMVTSYTLEAGKQYGIILRTTDGEGDISALSVDQIVAIAYESSIDALDNEIDDLKAQLSNFENQFYADSQVDITQYEYPAYIYPSTGKWSTSSVTKCCITPIPENVSKVTVSAQSGKQCAIAFLTSTAHSGGTDPNYATGETAPRWNAVGDTKTYNVPSDASYLYITKVSTNGTDLAPSAVTFETFIPPVEIDATLTQEGKAADSKTVGDKLKEVVPISIGYTKTNGKYVKYEDPDGGTLITASNFAYTDYISIDGISAIVYSRIYVPSQYTPRHGIAFYDENKTFISGIRSTTKGNSSGYETYTATVPETAKFVRCSLWDDTFSATYDLPSFIIVDKEEYDKTIASKIENVNNEFTPTAILHAVPQNEGVQNAILTARQFTDIMWTPVSDMPGIIYNNSTHEYSYRTHKKGCRQKGIPYGSGLTYGSMVGDSISFDAFATAVKSSGSILYTNSVYTDGGKKACYYGVACSKLVQACWGAPELVDSQRIYNLPGIEKIANAGEYTFDDIQLGDGIMKPDEHCTIVTDIIRSAVTLEVVGIEISEAVSPTCRRLVWSKGEFDEHFGNYSLYRYSYIENAKYHKAKYIDLEDGYEGVSNIPIAIRRGSYINMSTSQSYKADVDNTKWTTLHDVVNGVEQTSQISSSEITLPKDRAGYHEVYPTYSGGNRGNSSFYFVYELSVSGTVSDGSVTVTYSITEGAKPWVLVFDDYHYTFLTEDTGTITEEIPTGMTSCYVLFKSDYGTIKSSTISLT